MRPSGIGLALVALTGAAGIAQADTTGTVTVNAADSIYGAGQTGTPGTTAAGYSYTPSCASATTAGIPCGGYIPPSVAVTGHETVTFSSVTGTIVLNDDSGDNSNDANGKGAAVLSSSNSGANNISGITAPDAGYLVGVFLKGPLTSAPTAFNFISGTPGTINFPSLSPALGQVFFIGEGNNGGMHNAIQDFIAPAGSAYLYLGISDACGYNGSPSCYNDNLGNFSATYNIAPATSVPEPATLSLLSLGLAGIGFMRRRRHN